MTFSVEQYSLFVYTTAESERTKQRSECNKLRSCRWRQWRVLTDKPPLSLAEESARVSTDASFPSLTREFCMLKAVVY